MLRTSKTSGWTRVLGMAGLLLACALAGQVGAGVGSNATNALVGEAVTAVQANGNVEVSADMQQEKENGADSEANWDQEKSASQPGEDAVQANKAKDPAAKAEVGDEQKEQPKIRFNLGRKRDQGVVLRAKRPELPDEMSNPFFKNFQQEALVGLPPDWEKLAAGAGNAPSAGPGAATDGNVAAGGFDGLITAAVIEDEIKKAANLLTTQITTPVKFRSDYRDVHQTYSQLTALFAVNESYAADVRWHDDAAAFRELLGKTAAGTRVSTPQAYQMAVQTREELQQIVRGGRAGVEASDEPLEDWGTIIDRTPMMTWLEKLNQEQMRPQTSDENTIKKNAAELAAEAELVAMIAEILLQPEMDEFDDDDYRRHAEAMKKAALEAKSALELQNFQGVQDAVNAISQSCDDCHGDFQ